MKKILNKLSFGALALSTALVPVATFAVQTTDPETGTPTGLNPVVTTKSLDVTSILITIIYWILGFSAAVAVLFLILGGLQFVTSAGNTDRVTKAKQTILYAVLGIIVIVLAFVIVFFINTNLKKAVE